MSPKKICTLLVSAALCFTLAGCGTSGTNAEKGSIQYKYEEQTITMKAQPKRVVTLTAPLLNMAYSVGGTSVGRPVTTSPIPAETKSLPLIGTVQHINMEALVGLKPDFVIGEKSHDAKLESLLQSNKIPYILINYDGIKDNVPLLEFMGQVYGKEDAAKKIVADYNNKMSEIEKKASEKTPARVAVLRATGKSITAETPESICASMVELLKMNNVVVSHKNINLNGKTVPYSLEQLTADDPDIIFVVTMGNADEINKKMDEDMRSNPAWNHLKAVENHKVFFLPSDLFLLNPGVRTPEAMEKLYDLAYNG